MKKLLRSIKKLLVSKLVWTHVIIFIFLTPGSFTWQSPKMYQPPYLMSELVETAEYARFWKTQRHHGWWTISSQDDNWKWYFLNDKGQKCRFYR